MGRDAVLVYEVRWGVKHATLHGVHAQRPGGKSSGPLAFGGRYGLRASYCLRVSSESCGQRVAQLG